MSKKIRHKRGLKQDIPLLATSELGFTTDTEELYIGTNNRNIRLLDEKDKQGIERKLSEITLNVKDFGAKGDGMTDDSQAFQNALNTARDNNSLNLVVPEGNYVLDSYAEIFSNTHISLSKGAKIMKRASSNTSNVFVIGKTKSTSGYGSGARNISIDGGRFEGYGDYGVSITCHHVGGLTVKNAIFYKAVASGHVLDLAGCENVLVEDCEFIGMTIKTGREYVEAIQIDNSALGSLSDLFSNFDGLPTRNVVVQRCKFLPIKENGNITFPAPNPIGSHSFVEGMYFSNIKFIDNIVEDCPRRYSGNAGCWLRFFAVDGLEIRGNKFTNTLSVHQTCIGIQSKTTGVPLKNIETGGTGSIPALPCKNVVIEKNHISGFNSPSTGLPVIQLAGNSSGEYANGLRIIGNNFKNCFSPASSKGENVSADIIGALFCENLLIESNTVELVRRLCYVTDSVNVKVSKNTCKDCNNLAMGFLKNIGLTIEKNAIYSCVGGIFTTETTDLHVLNNEIYDITDEVKNIYDNVLALGTCINGVVSQNIIRNSKDKSLTRGIHVYTNGSNVMVVDNLVRGFTTDIEISTTTPNLIRRPW